jgi:hypothetical protein
LSQPNQEPTATSRIRSKPALDREDRIEGILELSPWTIRAWAKRGLIKTVKLGSRRLVPVAEIERIAAEGVDTRLTDDLVVDRKG